MNRIVTWAAVSAVALSPLALAATTVQAQAAPTTISAKAGAYSVSAKASTKIAVAKEDKVKVTGRVSPKAAGQKVVLQQRVGNKKSWKQTGTARIKKTGQYVLKDGPTTPGTRQYRVVKPASAGIRSGTSRSLTVVVYGWEKLGRRAAGPNTNVTLAPAIIATDYYGHSLVTAVAGTPASIEYTLGRKCVELKSSYALTDAAESGSSGAITVSTDGNVRATHSLAVGTVVADQVTDISGAFRLKFDLATSVTPAAVAAVAQPEVLCTR